MSKHNYNDDLVATRARCDALERELKNYKDKENFNESLLADVTSNFEGLIKVLMKIKDWNYVHDSISSGYITHFYQTYLNEVRVRIESSHDQGKSIWVGDVFVGKCPITEIEMEKKSVSWWGKVKIEKYTEIRNYLFEHVVACSAQKTEMKRKTAINNALKLVLSEQKLT